MASGTVYPYKLCPGYGSENLLFEFSQGVEEEDFIPTLLRALAPIRPKIDDIQDVWVNDEIWIHLECAVGKFLLTKDIWDLAFIMAEHNQEGILVLDSLLVQHERFRKEDVDFEEYRRPRSGATQ